MMFLFQLSLQGQPCLCPSSVASAECSSRAFVLQSPSWAQVSWVEVSGVQVSWVQVSWVPDVRFPRRRRTHMSRVQVGRSPECPVSTTPVHKIEPQQAIESPKTGHQNCDLDILNHI